MIFCVFLNLIFLFPFYHLFIQGCRHSSKMEKADILEMAVRHLKNLQCQQSYTGTALFVCTIISILSSITSHYVGAVYKPVINLYLIA